MFDETNPSKLEQNEPLDYGKNVEVRSIYLRHTQKASGAVGAGSQISQSVISEQGGTDSIALGSDIPNPAKDGYKIGWSNSERTLQTANKLIEGYLRDDERKRFNPGIKEQLFDNWKSKEFNQLYIGKWEENKKKIMLDRGYDPENYSKLSIDEQTEIAETAEEPVIEEWIDNKNSKLAELCSTEEAAAQLAVLVSRDIKMPTKLKSGSQVDLFRLTHKTITESLLMRIITLPDGRKPQKLKEIGGSLGLNEGYEIDTKIDETGKKTSKLTMYRVNKSGEHLDYVKTEYGLDMDELKRLAEIGKGLQSKDRGK